MAKRPLELTPDEYRTLLIMAHLGEWIINADRREGALRQEFVDTLATVCAAAADFGADAWVEHNPETGAPIPSLDLEQVAMPFLDDYDNNTFWDELILRMAERDAMRQVGEQQYSLMSDEARAALIDPLRERYHAEFSTHGVENLTIVNRNVN